MLFIPYRQKLRDPRWQKVRLKVFERDNWACQHPDCVSPEHTPLAVHHKSYVAGREPWDYPLTNFVTLCEHCHDLEHALSTVEPLIEGRIYQWNSLSQLLGFQPSKYLTEKDGQILCACIHREYNPDAPAILLPGDTEEIIRDSQIFAGQTNFIPVFIKAMQAGWEYHGRWRVEAVTTNIAEIAVHRRSYNLQSIPISMVLFLEQEPKTSVTTS